MTGKYVSERPQNLSINKKVLIGARDLRNSDPCRRPGSRFPEEKVANFLPFNILIGKNCWNFKNTHNSLYFIYSDTRIIIIRQIWARIKKLIGKKSSELIPRRPEQDQVPNDLPEPSPIICCSTNNSNRYRGEQTRSGVHHTRETGPPVLRS